MKAQYYIILVVGVCAALGLGSLYARHVHILIPRIAPSITPLQTFKPMLAIPASNVNIFASPSQPYTFKYPKTWTLIDLCKCCVTLEQAAPSGAPDRDGIHVLIDRWSNAAKQYGDIKTWAHAQEIVHILPVTVDSRPAIQGQIAIGDISGFYLENVVLVFDGNDGYEISFDPADSTLASDFNNLLATFRFIH
jgi:hypothetical protein